MDCSTFSFDLHVLGTPPALILSQDQTLNCLILTAARRHSNPVWTGSSLTEQSVLLSVVSDQLSRITAIPAQFSKIVLLLDICLKRQTLIISNQ